MAKDMHLKLDVQQVVFHTTYVACVDFIHKWGHLGFKVDYERQIFGETFHGNLI